jgi:YqaJ-like viral recombinase domain
MPDPTRKTISATESPALFDASPYITKWMLWQRIARGVDIEKFEHERMYWGKALQPLILAKAAEDLKLEVTPNELDQYERRGHLGCTRDARIYDPSRGWGSLEMKCVFDYGTFMRDWDGGKRVPRHYEIQLQQQMLVGEAGQAHQWGVIGAWVCGEMKYFERKPLFDFCVALENAAAEFLASVERNLEPQPFGEAIEAPVLTRIFDPVPDVGLRLEENWKLAETARMYVDFKEHERFYQRASASARVQLIAAAHNEGMDFGEVLLPGGINYTIKKASNGLRLGVTLPDELPDELIKDRED